METQHFGLIGFPLSHSFSPSYFRQKFAAEKIRAVYEAYELPALSMLPDLLKKKPELRGLNVTIPYKQEILAYLDEIDDVARHINAVNCIDIRHGRLKGYNTDATGFEESLRPLLQPFHKKALVLGTGGSSLAIKYVLEKLGIAFTPVSRSKSKEHVAYHDLSKALIQEHLLIINTTPLGMYPGIDSFPDLDYNALTPRHLLYDLVYNPAATKFLTLGNARGADIKNGLEMLHIQAEKSWEIWNR